MKEDKPIVRGLHKLYWINKEQIEKIEVAAMMHRRYANIGFKVVALTEGEQVILRVYQGKAFSENYSDRKRLIEIGHETFDFAMEGRNLLIGPSPYIHTPEDLARIKSIAFGEWIRTNSWGTTSQIGLSFFDEPVWYPTYSSTSQVFTTEELYNKFENEINKQTTSKKA